uniref:Uncharacterized protein n=1 Tax=Anguilla anguilla TaxID=7936 RepID=A0A0E9QZP6_ANGAN
MKIEKTSKLAVVWMSLKSRWKSGPTPTLKSTSVEG